MHTLRRAVASASGSAAGRRGGVIREYPPHPFKRPANLHCVLCGAVETHEWHNVTDDNPSEEDDQ